MELTPAATESALAIFRREPGARPPCDDCGGVHMRACPRIKRIHTRADPNSGAVVDRDVEYWPPGTWEEGVIFFDDLDV